MLPNTPSLSFQLLNIGLSLIFDFGLHLISFLLGPQSQSHQKSFIFLGGMIKAHQPPSRTPGADWRARLHAIEKWCAGPQANLQCVDWRAGLHANGP
jgi:hypothetical protein